MTTSVENGFILVVKEMNRTVVIGYCSRGINQYRDDGVTTNSSGAGTG